MSKKRILLADADSQIQADFRLALGEEWELTAVVNGTAALSEMERATSDVVVADLDLDDLDGGELLNRIQTTYPKTMRFILAREADHERMVKKVLGAHQFIGKPLDVPNLKGTIERALALENWLPKKSIRELAARIRTLPTIPSLYFEVQAALRAPDTTTEQVGAIIAKDMAMMTKLLQVLNSACFGLPRKITNPTEAVGILGFETVKSMVMTIKLLSQYDKVKPVYFSIDRLWRHSTEVARNAKQIALLHTEDAALAEAAFTGGLMHDLGKVVLASNFDEQYLGAQSLARKQGLPLWEVEKDIFGASHGEIGAYLLGLWGMPLDLHEIAAYHHHPSRSIVKKFTPLTAVHVANALEHEINPDKEGLPVAKLDEDYLAQIGVLDRLPAWREAVTKREFKKSETKARFIKAEVIRSELPVQPPSPKKIAPAIVEPPPESAGASVGKTWIYGSLGVAAVLVLLSWLGVQMLTSQLQKSNTAQTTATAKSPAPGHEEIQTAANPNPPAPEAKPVPETIPQANTTAVAKPAPSPAPTNLASLIPTGMVSTRPDRMPGFPDMKLQGIIFSDTPAAIINGKRVQANDKFNGVLVVDIKSTSVTLEYQKQRRTLVLE